MKNNLNLTINEGNTKGFFLFLPIRKKLRSVGKAMWGNEHFPYIW